MQAVELQGVQKTLLLPLWGRAVETRKAHPLLVDPTAVRIIEAIGYDFSRIAAGMSFVTQLAWVARCVHADRSLRAFLERFPESTVVNLGCGLDTTFERVDNGRVHWVDLDLPDVIALRRRFIQESDRRWFIASSMLDTAWLRSIDVGGPLFFTAMGVLYYVREADLRCCLKSIAGAVQRAEMLFDACSAFGLKTANERVIRDGGLDESARLVWSVERPASIESWDERIKLVEAYPLFRGMKRGRSLKERWGMFLSDRLRVMSMVHLRLGDAG